MIQDLIDFHSHFPSPNSIVCTAFPTGYSAPQQGRPGLQVQKPWYSQVQPLMRCEGLLPQFWNPKSWELLKAHLLDANVHLGEVGMDRRFANAISLDEQFVNLTTMLQYAGSMHKKVTIHSVQATKLTIKAIERASLPQFSVVWHGFTGSKETASMLYRLGVLVSIGPRFRGDFKPIADANPAWVLESDYEGTDENQYNEILSSHYALVAERLGMALDEVKEHCRGQAQAFADKPIPR